MFFMYSDFNNADVEHDLAVLVGQNNLNLYPDILSKPLAMKAAGVLVNVRFSLSSHQ